LLPRGSAALLDGEEEGDSVGLAAVGGVDLEAVVAGFGGEKA
jgi:hypothetical protein